MRKIKGPAIFLAQFIDDSKPFNDLSSICRWASQLGFKGVQLPTWDKRLFDLDLAAESQTYADEVQGIVNQSGMEISELSTHLQGQLVAVHPAYDKMFDGFAPKSVRGDNPQRTKWATGQLINAAKASRRLGLKAHATFSGALLWPTIYPWPQRPAGLVEQGFAELGKRWMPILQAFDESGVDLCYELHPGEDLHDGASFERFLEVVDNHSRANILYDPSHFVLQQLDYLQFLDIYHQRIKAFHVKDAEFNPSGRSGVYGGYQSWQERPGRFRSLGDGQINFNGIFSKLTQYGFQGWAVLEWECCIKNSQAGAEEGAEFIRRHLIEPATKAFDDFATTKSDETLNNAILGL
ncbi:sugar phosphate isomerase/epimerase family protein [Aliikangiella coralliicola]|uniref:Sugar phosphate isomerase/epimerase n=1 Tax=Aliikangiella coralliicola TaxID=2592383 RepID=A0A545U4H0_9GAMM|nr:sugar phosphate isomerase/epimerase [Aliikangiella coralliicola]TQV84369.1 sugar phosphate isomerase/epimerase [Aliikangiella coralliicola]